MDVLDLFSGIGGFALAVRRSGFGRVVAYCEVDPFCRAVLEARMDDGRLDRGPIYPDVREFDPEPFRGVGLVTGGFPCQDVSAAGKGAGIGGTRSGLWREMARIIAGVRPTWCLIENVPALRTRGADRVLADLEALGYHAWPLVVGAWSVGAPHRRDRVWIVAHANRGRLEGERVAHRQPEHESTSGRELDRRDRAAVVHAEQSGLEGHRADAGQPPLPEPRDAGAYRWPARPGEQQHEWEEPRLVAYAGHSEREGWNAPEEGQQPQERGTARSQSPPRDEGEGGPAQQPMGRSTPGLPARLVRRSNREALRAYGNSIVPQVAEAVLRAIRDA